jgi:hypothetical protein
MGAAFQGRRVGLFASKMRVATLVLLLPAALDACGSGDDESGVEVNDCVVAGGSYLFEWSERDPARSTACGAIPEQVMIVPSSGEVPLGDGCRTLSEEGTGCRVRNVVECNQSGPTTTVSTAVNWVSDGSGASGLQTFTVSLPDGSACSSTYDVIASRL